MGRYTKEELLLITPVYGDSLEEVERKDQLRQEIRLRKLGTRRCQARSRMTGKQCRSAKAIDDPKYCRFHMAPSSKRKRANLRTRLRKMSYARYLGESLQQRVEYAAKHSQLISLREELAAARALMVDNFKLYEYIEEKAKTADIPEAKKKEVIASAANQVILQLKEVASIAKDAHKIENDSLLDMRSLHVVLLQVAEVVEKNISEIAETHDLDLDYLNTKLGDEIRKNIRLPKANEQTSIRPGQIDDEVRTIDALIAAPQD